MCFLEDIEHPVKVARAVMEDTPHVLLAGMAPEISPLHKGLNARNLLTPDSKRAWEKWRQSAEYKPIINVENHDTIGMIAQDLEGNLAGACTTSGLAYKLRGRVGDSPIIGAGLFRRQRSRSLHRHGAWRSRDENPGLLLGGGIDPPRPHAPDRPAKKPSTAS